MLNVSSVLAACLCLSGSAFCQNQVPASPPTLKQRPPTNHRLQLDVVVTNKAGQPIPDLSQADFTLLDNNRTQPLVSFQAVSGTSRAVEPGLQVVFVLDAVNNSYQRVAFARLQLEKFLREDNGRLSWPASIVFFTDTATEVAPIPTLDGNALAASLESNIPGLRTLGRSAGFWGADERTNLSLSTFARIVEYEAKQPGRKLLIWLSSGWPLLSGPGIDLTPSAERSIFGNIVDFTDRLEKARITLYTVDPLGMADAGGFRTYYYEGFLAPLRSWNQAQNGNLSLQVLAVHSGGRVFNSGNDLAHEIAGCLNDAKAYYTLVFDAAPAQRPDEYHSLQVKVDQRGLVARTRSGYYAQAYHDPDSTH